MEFTSPEAERRYDALRAVLPRTVVGLDFDGTLSPIVDDPAKAYIQEGAGEVLGALADRVAAVVIVTGRPVHQVLELGDLETVGRAVADRGQGLLVLGQYGNERWSSADQRIVSPEPPEGLARFQAELADALERADAADAHVEEKGLAVAVHTRRMADGAAAYERLRPVLEDLAAKHGLALEPGKLVLEVRAPGTDKGAAVRLLVDEHAAEGFLFAGDDLGDVEAFKAVAELREDGLVGLLVCSRSDEQNRLVELADVVVDGPEGVVDLLRHLAG